MTLQKVTVDGVTRSGATQGFTVLLDLGRGNDYDITVNAVAPIDASGNGNVTFKFLNAQSGKQEFYIQFHASPSLVSGGTQTNPTVRVVWPSGVYGDAGLWGDLPGDGTGEAANVLLYHLLTIDGTNWFASLVAAPSLSS